MTPEEIAFVVHAANDALRSQLGENPSPKTPDDLVYAVVGETLSPASSNEESHKRWLVTAPADHPNNVPYADLPEGQKRKDALFRAIVGALS